MILFSEFKKYILLGFICFAVASCGGLKQNVQVGNVTGKIADNKWDYYNGTPQHYTSIQRSIFKDGILTVNEVTDAFSGTFNFQESSEKASVVFNGETLIMTKLEDPNELVKGGWEPKFLLGWNDFYISEDRKVYSAVQRTKQLVLFGKIQDSGERTDIAFHPSRYLACKKLALMKQTKDAAVMASLVKTALVAGVQSYTSYSTSSSQGNINSQYGNFGYTGNTTTRDYSWAGDRASDALETVFSGSSDAQSLNAAWNSMNCW